MVASPAMGHVALLHPVLKFAMSSPWPTFQFCSSSQQILATPLMLLKSMILQDSDFKYYNNKEK